MSRYINADALIEEIESCSYETWSKDINRTWWAQAVMVKDNIKQCIKRQPTAEEVIVLPCKVGDIVYSYLHSWKHEDGIAAYQITNITITQNKKGEWTKKYRAMQVKDGKTIDWQLNFAFDEIGKTVFLMKIGAEKTLAERKEK